MEITKSNDTYFRLVKLSNPHDKLNWSIDLSNNKPPHDKFKLNLSICHGNYKEQWQIFQTCQAVIPSMTSLIDLSSYKTPRDKFNRLVKL